MTAPAVEGAAVPASRGTGSSAVTPAPVPVEGLRRALLVGLPVLAALAVVGLLAAGWPDYWRYVATEDTPMTWLESVLLLLTGVIALQLAALGALRGGTARAESRVWLVVAAGFAFLALDDRFALHERLRDRVLADLGIGLPWGAPGDYVLLVVAVVGLVLLPRVLRVLAADPLSRRLFLAGVAVAALVVATDTIDPERLSLSVERLEQSAEEVVELASHVLFLLALGVRLLREVARGPRQQDEPHT